MHAHCTDRGRREVARHLTGTKQKLDRHGDDRDDELCALKRTARAGVVVLMAKERGRGATCVDRPPAGHASPRPSHPGRVAICMPLRKVVPSFMSRPSACHLISSHRPCAKKTSRSPAQRGGHLARLARIILRLLYYDVLKERAFMLTQCAQKRRVWLVSVHFT